MKILHVIDSGGLYGAEVMLLNLMSEQLLLGLQPVLASIGAPWLPEKALEKEARLRGVPVRAFRMIPGPNLAGVAEVLRFARGEGVDLIHSHGFKGNILLGLLPRSIRRLPMVATVHGWTWNGGVNRMMLYEWLDSLALRRIDRVVLVSAAMREHPRLKGGWGARMQVVANGIALPVPAPPPREALNGDVLEFCRGGFTVGSIGRLSPEKGFHLLLEGVASLVREGRDVRLVIIGEGGERSALERQARGLALEDRVLLPGYLANARAYLPFFHLFALSSLTEGLPLVLLEALAAGVPVVATAVGGVPEVLQLGRGGLLVPPGDTGELARGVRNVMENEVCAARRAACGKEVVCSRYSIHAMASGYVQVYRRLVESAAGGEAGS